MKFFVISLFLIFNFVLSIKNAWEGQHLRIEEAPYIVDIIIWLKYNSTQTSFTSRKDLYYRNCTGSFIHPQWIITAASCFWGLIKSNSSETQSKGSTLIAIELTYGSTDWRDSCGKKSYVTVGKGSEDSTLILHPSYPKSASELHNGNNIALIKLPLPIYLTLTSNIVALMDAPWIRNEYNEPVDRICTLIGFSRNTHGDTLLHSRDYWMKYKSKCGCYNVTKDHLCRVVVNSDNGCSGIKGAPLLCDGKLVGLYDYIHRCNSQRKEEVACDEPGLVVIYTYMCKYISWIRKYVGIKAKPCNDSF